MIKIDKTRKEILFAPNEMKGERPPKRSFPLLSAYVCPFCDKILAAYFQGQMPEAEIAYYREDKPRYLIGGVAGGHYLKAEHHQVYYDDPDKCPWEVYSRRGIVENLRQFARQHEVTLVLVKRLAEKVESLPGFCVVKDVCGRDAGVLLYSEEMLLKDLREKDGFDAYWKAKENLGKYLMEVMRQKQDEGSDARPESEAPEGFRETMQ